MFSPVRIVIVEDELMIRSTLRIFFERKEHWYVVGEAADCKSACSVIEAMRPDIVLLDLNLGQDSGLDCLPQLLAFGDNRVLVLTGQDDTELHARALAAGASAVLSKGDPPEEIVEAIQHHAEALLRGKPVELSFAETTNSVLESTPADDSRSSEASIAIQQELNQNELQIIELVAQGSRDSEITVQLGITTTTLHQTLSEIYRKLNVHDRVALVVYAFQHHLVTPQT